MPLTFRRGWNTSKLKLHPGESIRSPRILAVHYKGDAQDASNLFRQTMLAHVMPRSKGMLQTPPIAHLSTSFDELNLTDEPSVLSHLASLKGLGFDHLWLDALFHERRLPERNGQLRLACRSSHSRSNSVPQRAKTRRGRNRKGGSEVPRVVRTERVAEGTLIAQKHPEFVLSPAGNGSGLLNLGLPEARTYMTQVLSAAITQWNFRLYPIRLQHQPLVVLAVRGWEASRPRRNDRDSICRRALSDVGRSSSRTSGPIDRQLRGWWSPNRPRNEFTGFSLVENRLHDWTIVELRLRHGFGHQPSDHGRVSIGSCRSAPAGR